MKKVLALVLAVMMLATVAMAAPKYISTIAPNSSVKIDRFKGVSGGVIDVVASSTNGDVGTSASVKDSGDAEDAGTPGDNAKIVAPTTEFKGGIADMFFRAVTTENYTISNVRIVSGRSVVKGVSINDKEQRVEVKFVDDLNNTYAKEFELNFTVKGKGKMILREDDLELYNQFTNKNEVEGKRVTLPSVKVSMYGKVGYGKVEVDLGTDSDEDIDQLESVNVKDGDKEIDIDTDVIKFRYNGNLAEGTRIAQAGAYTADAILTQNYDEGLTMEARVYSGDVLFFGIDHDPDKDIVSRLADSDADMDFYLFNEDKNFTTFNSNVKLVFNDAEESDYVYQIKDNKLVPVGKYDEDEGCWVVKTRTLGQYIVSDVELKEFEAAAGTVDGNPDTGANDVVGIATALAAVALVSAAAVSLKK